LGDGIVITLYVDRTGILWIGTYSGGLDAFDPSQDRQARFTHYRHDPENPRSLGEGAVNSILEDRAGVLWVGTSGGGLCSLDRDAQIFTCYRNDPQDLDSLSNNTVMAIHEDREGLLWIGTSGGLNRFAPQSGTFSLYTTADGLAHDAVAGILEDGDGRLWLSTARGLSHFDPATRIFRNYTASDGLQGDSFGSRAYHKASTGELLFGGPNGLTHFNPDDIQGNPYIPPVVVTSLRLADEPVTVGGDSPLQRSILDTQDLVLSYDDRILSFEFAALSYSSPDKNRYRFKLEGFEEDWREVDSARRFATYTNLDPGDYVFRVMGSNNDGLWNEQGASIALTVTPPWWETAWFRIGLGVLAVGLILGGYRWRVRTVEARNRTLEAQVEERTKQLQVASKAAVEAQQAAEAANQAKSMFLASMSHELRTPLNAILGFAHLLARDPGISAQQSEILDVINRSGEHLLGMVNDILSLSRIEAGRIELRQETFHLVQMLRDIGRMFQSRAEGKGLGFSLELEGGLPEWVQGDAGKLRQVLINLLGNAVKFTAQGEVWLRARAYDVAEDLSTVQLQVEVQDTGPGIPSDQLEKVFEAFVQGEHTPNSGGGTGLGLAISRSLVEVMGGEIAVQSQADRGTLFRVTVPLQLTEAGPAATVQAPAVEVIGLQAGQPEWRTLVVDDNDENRALLVDLLARAGFAVQEAENGREAVAAFEQWRPHLIWMDMRMPVLDGYQATRKIRALPGEQEVKIVAVTASALDEQREEILAAGCDDAVRKPYREHEIYEAMAAQLGVQYRYKEWGTAPAREPRTYLTPERLAELPAPWLQELDQATLALDQQAASVLIDRIDEQAPEIAQELRVLVQGYQMARIRDLLKGTDTKHDR
jgi:signal transduction histidine kinase/DNA-binding response OmpR family regulator